MGARYLPPSERASVRWLAAEITRWRRLRRARRVRTFVLPARSPIPVPHSPVDIAVMRRVLEGLQRLPGVM